MAANTLSMKHGWVWALSIFIFFCNTFLLPEGFTYTLLLTPVWLYLLHVQGKVNVLLALLCPLAVYAVIHFALGVNISYYFISLTVISSLVAFLVVLYFVLSNPSVNLDLIFRDIAILNFMLAAVSLPLLLFPAVRNVVWYMTPISQQIVFPRLKLFTEEASHYSFLLAIISIYFYSRALFFKARKQLLTLLIVSLPLLLSFSFGVLACTAISFLVITIVYFRRIFHKPQKRNAVLILTLLLAAVFILLYKYYPANPLFLRVHNIFNGSDTSARGRTYEAFILANKIIAQKSFFWGIGSGQLKLIGRDIIIQYYYYFDIPPVIRIPNAAAETIVYFGYVGFAVRLLIEIVLFITTKVYSNPYRLWLFLFVFIYQFTGSYITNVAEYLVWLIVFCPVFPEFVMSKQYRSPKLSHS